MKVATFAFGVISCFFSTGVSAQQTPINPVKQIIIHSARNPGNKMTIDMKTPTVSQNVDLGDDWDGVVELVGPTKDQALRMQLVFETSMSIHEEGPHLDLTNWKHYKSDPQTIWPEDQKNPGAHRYKFDSDRIANAKAFPFVSKKELITAVRAAMKSGGSERAWDRLAAACETPQTGSCSVGISKVWLQVFPKDQVGGKPLAEIVFSLPLGC